MPQRNSGLTGAPCWVDLFTSDTRRSEDFYGRLFGWTAEHAGEEYGGYISFRKGENLVAGGMGNYEGSGSPDGWFVYLMTPDVESVAATAGRHGGTVIAPAMQIGEMGSMTVVTDPGGAVIGGWQPGTLTGIDVIAEPGTPTWFELHTREYGAAVQFYKDVFSWDAHVASDADDFKYTTLGKDESAAAGIMDVTGFPTESFPTRWSVYFAVEDADAAVARIAELGGRTLHGPDDSPYGRLVVCEDPVGVQFKLVQ